MMNDTVNPSGWFDLNEDGLYINSEFFGKLLSYYRWSVYADRKLKNDAPQDGFLSGGGSINSTYDMVVYQKVAQDLAERGGGIGVREMLFNQISGKYRAG